MTVDLRIDPIQAFRPLGVREGCQEFDDSFSRRLITVKQTSSQSTSDAQPPSKRRCLCRERTSQMEGIVPLPLPNQAEKIGEERSAARRKKTASPQISRHLMNVDAERLPPAQDYRGRLSIRRSHRRS